LPLFSEQSPLTPHCPTAPLTREPPFYSTVQRSSYRGDHVNRANKKVLALPTNFQKMTIFLPRIFMNKSCR
jgi:hypothetical protein